MRLTFQSIRVKRFLAQSSKSISIQRTESSLNGYARAA